MPREGSFALAVFGKMRKVQEPAFSVSAGRKSFALKRIDAVLVILLWYHRKRNGRRGSVNISILTEIVTVRRRDSTYDIPQPFLPSPSGYVDPHSPLHFSGVKIG